MITAETHDDTAPPVEGQHGQPPHWRRVVRVALYTLAIALSVGAWHFNAENTFTRLGIVCWLGGILAWVILVLPGSVARLRAFRSMTWRARIATDERPPRRWWPLPFLAAIVALGAMFRFYDLAAYPPEMTSDHVEKVLDALRIARGARPVFLAGNGGREVAHFYVLAALHNVFAIPLDFTLLKALSAFEGTLGLIAIWWLARVLLDPERGALGDLTGLTAAALAAIGHWPIMLSRLGLRIALTPLVVAIVATFFVRALRFGRTGDFVATGLSLGVGLYCYQAVRMLPVLLLCGLVVGMLAAVRSRRTQVRLIGQFSALAVVATAVALPLIHFAVEYPQDFWRRTSTRILGDATLNAGDQQGLTIILRALGGLYVNLGAFGDSFRTSLLMFNVRGDQAWFEGTPGGLPALDRYTGILFIIGAVAWAVLLVTRRDPAYWLLPFGLAVMLLPTALAFAFPAEVPSATRASGTIPFAFILAAYPVALLLRFLGARFVGLPDRALTVSLIALLSVLIAQANIGIYFDTAMPAYRVAAQPHQQAGMTLRAFVAETDAPGNAFVVAYARWWDHRAVAIESGDPDWDNGILRDSVQANIVGRIKVNGRTRYAFRPDRPVLLFLNQQDGALAATLAAWLPNGTIRRVVSDIPPHDFLVLTAPPVGCAWLGANIGSGYAAGCP